MNTQTLFPLCVAFALSVGCQDALDESFESTTRAQQLGMRTLDPIDGPTLPSRPWSPGPRIAPDTDLLSTAPVCQSHDWLAKYIHYRKRLVGDGTIANPGFVSVGTAPGQSFVVSSRRPDEGLYEYGDTTAHHGKYLAVLGSESRAFTILGADTTATHEELALALDAFDRLDYASTGFFNNGQGALDGFFIRNDAPASFMTLPNGAQRFPGYDKISTNPTTNADPNKGHVMSQDQVIGLFYGLATVIELVDPNASVNGRNLRTSAQAIMHRIMHRILGQFQIYGGWAIRTPDGQKVDTVLWGGYVNHAEQLALIADRYVGMWFGGYNGHSYAQGVVSLDMGFTWTWWGTTSKVNKGMATSILSVLPLYSAHDFGIKSGNNRSEIAPLHRKVVTGQDFAGFMEEWMYESLLERAPCSGPCIGTNGCDEADGWKGPHRFGVHTISRSGHYQSADQRHEEYPGLDYMLLHNLYLIHKNGRYRVNAAPRNTQMCSSNTPLDMLLAYQPPGTGSWPTRTYDATMNACTTLDLERQFCGRTFASWLVDASRGHAVIHTPGYKWACSGAGTCTLHPSSRQGTQGTSGPDLILGSAQGDFLDGQQGSDCIYGFGGDDTIQGNLGFDELHGNDGHDDIYGEWLGAGGAGHSDMIFGGAGWDYIRPQGGDDDSDGGPDNDNIVEAGNGEDVLLGGAGDDYLHGGDGTDVILGGPGNDTLYSGAGGNNGGGALSGGPGDDVLHGGPAADYISLGPGSDLAYGYGSNDQISANDNSSGSDYNKIEAGDGADSVYCGEQPCEIWGGAGNDRLQGSSKRDKINGGDCNFWGFGCDDVLLGMGGNDFLRGGDGNDLLLGGDGDDRLCGNNHHDHLDQVTLSYSHHDAVKWALTNPPQGANTCNSGTGWDTVDYNTCTWVPDNHCSIQALINW